MKLMLQVPVLAVLAPSSSACVLLSRCSMQAVLAGSSMWRCARLVVDPANHELGTEQWLRLAGNAVCMQQGTLERADGGAQELTALTYLDC